MQDKNSTIAAFLDAAAAKSPTPGGGSVAALAGALAASMGEMCVNYSIGKKGLEAHQADFAASLRDLSHARAMLLQLMVEDQAAYEAMTAARKLPADDPQRQGKLDAATLACIRVPESIAAVGVAILQQCDRLAETSNLYLLSDLAVCADLAMAAVRCGVNNVRANISSLTDLADRKAAESMMQSMQSRAVAMIQRIEPRIWERIGRGK